MEAVTEDRLESPEPSLSNVIENQTEITDPNLSDEAMYDPLAIIRELGEAVDSPNIVEEADKTGPSTQPETDLAAIEGTIWAKSSADLLSGISRRPNMQIYIADA